MVYSVTCEDGPASEAPALSLRRVPRFMRLVTAGGQWDACDQLDDAPNRGETIHVYRLVHVGGTMHVTRAHPRSGRRLCEWITPARYRLHEVQPPDDVLRDTARWREWCIEEGTRLGFPDVVPEEVTR